MLKLKPLIAAKAKENLTLSPGRGKKGCQNSDNLIETRKELSKLAGVSLLEDRTKGSLEMEPKATTF